LSKGRVADHVIQSLELRDSMVLNPIGPRESI
jgi:hypothetical protein